MPKAPRRREPARKATPEDAEDPSLLFRRDIYVKAKRFEERVAELFGLLGYRTIVDYLRDDMQFDVRLEMPHAAFPTCALVECKDLGEPVTQKQVREFGQKVADLRETEKKPYQAIMVARSGFVNNAHAVAQTKLVHLLTFQQLVLSLVDLGPNLEAAVRTFEGTPLQRLYVEQDAILESEIRSGDVEPKGLTSTVLTWLDRPNATFLALLGDFGCGKSSFCKRLAWDLATQSKEKPGEVRMPILIDLREGGSTTVTLENLLTHHFQRLSSQPFNPQALLHLNREGHILLIFDGFDETIAYSEPGRYLENLRQILRAAEGKAKVLLTCRTHYFRDRPEVLKRLERSPELTSSAGATRLYEEIQERAGAEVGYVLEFREPQIEEYLKKALPRPADWKTFREQIRQTYNLEELAERPFLLEIIVKTLPRLLERGTEVTIADLYETYCDSWFAHTDSHLKLTWDHKAALVDHLACLIWNSPENRVHYSELANKAAEFFQNHPLSVIEKQRIDYEVRTALFLHRDAEGYYSFIHRSFLEFFIARTLRAGLLESSPNCLGLKRITREVAFFLEFWPAAKEIPRVTGKILETDYQPGISENALLLLYFHTRATLGALVGPGSDVEQDWAEVRKTFSRMRPKTLQLAGADLEGAALPGIDLSGAMLEGGRLVQADLRQASLDNARLARVALGFADLRRGFAQKADLSEADLNHLDGQDVSFRGTVLTNADLSFARLVRADLQDTKMDGVQTIGTSLLEAQQLDLRIQLGHSGTIRSVAWSPDGRVFATGSDDSTIKLWDVGSGRLLSTLQGHEGWVNSVAWAPGGERIASASSDKTVRLWDAASGRILNTLQGHEEWVNSVAWAPGGELIASASHDKTVRLWDAASGRIINTLQGHENRVNSVAWAPGGELIASASSDKTVRLWDAASGRILNTIRGHKNRVVSVAWAPGGERIASASYDKTARLWDAASGRILNTIQWYEHGVNSVAWAPGGQRIASASDDKTVRLWDAASGRILNTLLGHEEWVNSVAWAPGGERIASASSDNTVRVWDAASGCLLSTLKGHEEWVNSIAWAPGGERIASASDDKTVRLWDAASGRLLNTLLAHENIVHSVAWAPGGERIASASYDHTVHLWDAASGRLLNTLLHETAVHSVAWEPRGERIASASYDNTVHLWDPDSGRLLNTLLGHESIVFSVAWAPSGERIASASYDNTVRLWDSNSGEIIRILEIPSGVTSLTWERGGQRLALSFRQGFSEVWDLEADPPRPLARLYQTPGGSGFAATPDGYVSGSPEALEYVRFGEGWALYDLTDVPERFSPERVAAALSGKPLVPEAKKNRRRRK